MNKVQNRGTERASLAIVCTYLCHTLARSGINCIVRHRLSWKQMSVYRTTSRRMHLCLMYNFKELIDRNDRPTRPGVG